MPDNISAVIEELRVKRDALTQVIEALQALASPATDGKKPLRAARQRKASAPAPVGARPRPVQGVVFEFLQRQKRPLRLHEVCGGLKVPSGSAYAALTALLKQRRVVKRGVEWSVAAPKEGGAHAGGSAETP